MNKLRVPFWDIVRGIAIFLVLLGHSIQCIKTGGACYDDWIYRFIYSFHMPLFMFVSGYFFYPPLCKYKPKEVILRKIKSILIPLVCFGVIQMPLYYDEDSRSILGIVKLFLSCVGILWFLLQVFYCSVVVTIIKYFFKDNLYVYVLFFIISLLIPNFYGGLDRISFMFPFFALGYHLNKYGKMELITVVKTKKVILFSSFFLMLLIFYNRNSFVYVTHTCVLTSELGFFHQSVIDIYRILIGIAGTLSSLQLLKILSTKEYLDFSVILYSGRFSLGIYGFQSIFFGLFPTKFLAAFSNCISVLLVFLMSIFFSILLTFIASKSQFLNKLFLGAR